MRDRLKEKWGNLLTGQEIPWMLWAGYIVQKLTHEHDELIAKPPPSNIVRFFQPQSTSAQEHILRVQRSVTLAADVVDGLLLNLAALRASHKAHTNLFKAELDQMEAMLTSKKSIIDAFDRDVAINPDDAKVLSALAAIPNQEDLDHA
ncbi:hypothetical protein AC1031_017458 [Aphanomyces cochlioides]|nr:hypothetical protein AC1031_017458 [Aphanomyces cochlioides]